MDACNKSVFQLLNSYVKEKPNYVFIENEVNRYTISEFFNTVCATANKLVDHGVKKGDIVSILVKKDIETIIYFFACQVLGAVALMIDEHECLEKLEEEFDIHTKYQVTEDRKVTKESIFPMLKYDYFSATKETTIAILTSGSTGNRKLIKQSQYAFINDAFDSKDFGWYEPTDVALAFLPMSHVFAMALLFTAIYHRFSVFVAKSTDLNYLLDCIEEYHITRFNCVPTLLLKMAELKDQYDLSSLKCAYVGGAPCSQKEYLKIENDLGVKLIPVYGMTECVGIASGAYYDNSTILANTVGHSYPMNDIKLADDGEIMVKGPQMCNGYFNGELPTCDGYLLTGDIGKFDKNGYLYIVGRKKEIIIRNGNNISIAEISKKISSIDFFKEYAVVGIADDEVGEMPALAVVLKRIVDHSIIYEALRKCLRKNEMPKKVVYLDSIPLLENGKIDNQSVKKMFA